MLAIQRGPTRQPIRLLLHGVEGIGKTTFAADIPGAVFLSSEDGGGDLDIARIPVDSWAQVLDAVDGLSTEPHDFRTLVIDTIDFLERLCWAYLVKAADVGSIEEVGKGFGKGYILAVEEMAKLAQSLDALRAKRRMNIVLLAHTHVKNYKNPGGSDYDRYQIRMQDRAVALWSGWVDIVLFANYDIQVKVETRGQDPALLKRGKAKPGEPDRLLYSQPRAAFDAKSRYELPAEMDLDWSAFAAAIRWDEREAVARGSVSAAPIPTDGELRAAMVRALRELDWTQDDVGALLKEHGAAKLVDVPNAAKAAVLAAFNIKKNAIAAK